MRHSACSFASSHSYACVQTGHSGASGSSDRGTAAAATAAAATRLIAAAALAALLDDDAAAAAAAAPPSLASSASIRGRFASFPAHSTTTSSAMRSESTKRMRFFMPAICGW